MAASQPGYLQPAMIVASAFHIEFEDDSLVSLVGERAKALNAWEHIKRIGFSANLESAQAEPPEREAARQRWKTSQKDGGMCDECRTLLRRGEGYLVEGRVFFIGDQEINVGIEILCQKCFDIGKKNRTIP
jgi:hypothetical protein